MLSPCLPVPCFLWGLSIWNAFINPSLVWYLVVEFILSLLKNTILWFLTRNLSENVHLSRIWGVHPKAGSDTQLQQSTRVCAAHRLFKWWHSISCHPSFKWQFPLSEGHSQKVSSGPKSALKSEVSMYQTIFLNTWDRPKSKKVVALFTSPLWNSEIYRGYL